MFLDALETVRTTPARGLLPGFVAGAVARGPLRAACSALLAPLAGLDRQAPAIQHAEYDRAAPHPTPVVFVHGFFGHPLNLRPLRRFLAARGFHNAASFSWSPTLDYERLAARLRDTIEAVCRETGVEQVDVVGHSLGGLIARHLIQTGAGHRIRRLVTLGSPTVGPFLASQELAIFGSNDQLIATPDARRGPHGRVLVVPRCGHLGLLVSPRVWRATVAFLGERSELRVAA